MSVTDGSLLVICMMYTSLLLIFNKMTKRIEQQNSIVFCQKFKDFTVETIGKIQQTFSDYSIEITNFKKAIYNEK